MNSGVVIGGGRWGRIIAEKLSMLGVRVVVATNFPSTSTDISREDIALLNPAPSLIFVVSKSIYHERDFELVASLGAHVWIEKNFSGMSTSLLVRFLKGDNFVFNQQLFNTSLDRHADIIKSASDFRIATDVDRVIITCIDLFDWICHDLSLIARILWLRGETVPLTITTNTVQFSLRVCTAQYVINGIGFNVVLKESPLRCRTVTLGEEATLVSGRDGVLWSQSGYGRTDVPGGVTADEDLLGSALKVALHSRTEDVRSLTKIAIDLHRVTFPLVSKLNYKRNLP